MGINNRTFEKQSLLISMKDRSNEYKELEAQFDDVKSAFQQIVDLDNFQGRAAQAIKRFYQAQIEIIEAWLIFIEVHRTFLEEIPSVLLDHGLDTENYIQLPFLENDLRYASDRSNYIASSQQDSMRRILNSINDIIPLKTFSLEDFHEQLQVTTRKREGMIEDISVFDNRLTSEYEASADLQQYIMKLFGTLLDASAQSGVISPMNFRSSKFYSSQTYQLKDDVMARYGPGFQSEEES